MGHVIVQFELLVLAVGLSVILLVKVAKFVVGQISPEIVPLVQQANITSRDLTLVFGSVLVGYVAHDAWTHLIPVLRHLLSSTPP